MNASIFLLALSLGQLQQPANPINVQRDNEALATALMDIQTVPVQERIFTRYIWLTRNLEHIKGLSFAWASLSTSPVIEPWRPVPVARGRINLARVDLRIGNLLTVWEELQFEPKFSLLVTKDVLAFLQKEPLVRVEQDVLLDVPPFVQNGVRYTKRWDKKITEVPFSQAKMDVLRLLGEHIDPILFAALVDATGSQAPVVTIDYFLFRGLSTIKGIGLYKTLYGGLYFELSGTPRAGKKGTDLDALFESLGIGSVEAGITAEKVFEKIPSDQRIGVFRSGVTGKPRQVEVLRTLVARDGQAIISITHDIKDQDVDIATHPMMNLLKFKDAGREIIYTRLNGMNGFVLANGDGKFVEEVPPDIASDTTIPTPHTKRLQSAISCIRCHSNEGGWRVLTNDVKKLLGNYLDIFGDLTQKKKPANTVQDRLAGLYAGDLERILMPSARNSYANAVLIATGPWKNANGQLNVVQLASDQVAGIYREYWYDVVTPKKALEELGYTPEQDPVKQLKSLVPPVNVIINGIIPEDPRIGALLSGISINRWEWDAVYAIVANRVQKSQGVKK